jgi:hypothetical protein
MILDWEEEIKSYENLDFCLSHCDVQRIERSGDKWKVKGISET